MGDLLVTGDNSPPPDLLTGCTKATLGPWGDVGMDAGVSCRGRIVNPLNLPNMLLFMAAASSFGGRSREAFMSSGLVGIDFPPGPFERFVLPDMGEEAFDEEPSLMTGFGLEVTQERKLRNEECKDGAYSLINKPILSMPRRGKKSKKKKQDQNQKAF